MGLLGPYGPIWPYGLMGPMGPLGPWAPLGPLGPLSSWCPACCTSRLPSLSGTQVVRWCGALQFGAWLLGGWSLPCSLRYSAFWLVACCLVIALLLATFGHSVWAVCQSPFPWYFLHPPLLALLHGEMFASQVFLPTNWFDEFSLLLKLVKPFVRGCWLKTVAGAWCTSYRFRHMPGTSVLPCCFGCNQSDDNLVHCMRCPILQQFVSKHFEIEDDLSVQSRLCLAVPSVVKLRRLAVAHSVYSQLSSHPDCQHFMNSHIVTRESRPTHYLERNPWDCSGYQ